MEDPLATEVPGGLGVAIMIHGQVFKSMSICLILQEIKFQWINPQHLNSLVMMVLESH